MITISFANAGRITTKNSAINALAQWANDCERKLLIGISCGTYLPRERHHVWAEKRIVGARYLIRRRGRCVDGYISIPTGSNPL